MSIPIRHKRSNTPGAAPVVGDLVLGEIAVNTNDGKLFLKKDNGSESIVEFKPAVDFFKSITIESPTDSEDISFFYVPYGITVTEIVGVVKGSASPSVTLTVRYNSDRSATGTEVVTGGSTFSSTTTGQSVTVFNSANIPSGSFVWIETTATVGTVDEIHLTLTYAV